MKSTSVFKQADVPPRTERCTLGELGIQSISLNYTENDRVDRNGNRLCYRGQISMADASPMQRQITGVYFRIGRNLPAN